MYTHGSRILTIPLFILTLDPRHDILSIKNLAHDFKSPFFDIEITIPILSANKNLIFCIPRIPVKIYKSVLQTTKMV